MKHKWIGKNVNLKSLAETIAYFLETKKFEILRENPEGSYQIFGIFRSPENEIRSVQVCISGTPNDFTIQLTAGEQARSILKFGSLISLFGGGLLLLKGHQSAEFYEKFEEEFWSYVEGKVSQLEDSTELLS